MAGVPKQAEPVGLLPDDGRIWRKTPQPHHERSRRRTVRTAGQVNLPLDNTGLVLDEAGVKGIEVGPKMSYLEVLSRSARIHH